MPIKLPRLYQNKLDVMLEQLAKYASLPDESAVHNVRTSIRRLEVAFKALPASCRNKAVRNYHHRIRRFCGMNSGIRDCDVLLGRLAGYDVAAKSPLTEQLTCLRTAGIRKALGRAEKLLAMKVPPLTPAKKSKDDGLPRRVRKLSRDFLKLVPLVLEDESHIEDVHSLRKIAKQLYYLFELDSKQVPVLQIEHISAIQKLAGEIHDCDITITFLSQNQQACKEASGILAAERQLRHDLYQRLCSLLNRSGNKKGKKGGRRD